jgi:multicomponent Na+:H+ antiporter subunit D
MESRGDPEPEVKRQQVGRLVVNAALLAALWLLAGVYAGGYLRDDPREARFFGLFLLAMTGNFGLIVAQDMVSFCALFALMTFSSYGLVVHTGSDEARRASVTS